MKKVRCLNGHYFDNEAYDKCPLCNAVKVEENDGDNAGSTGATEEKKHLFSWKKNKKNDAEIVHMEEGTVAKTFSIFGDNSNEDTPIKESYSDATDEPKVNLSAENKHDNAKPVDVFTQKNVSQVSYEESKSSVAVSIKDEINEARRDSNKTIGFFSMPSSKPQENTVVSENSAVAQSEPLVGWIVCVKGVNFGKGFSVFSGMNSVGRNPDNRIVVPDDSGISREKHALIVYEPKKRVFYIKSGESSGLTYVNDEIVMETQKLEAWDKITLGGSDFLLVPLCCERFSWEEYMTR